VIYRFGDHTLDTERLSLTANGEEIPVEPQVFSLLQYLVEHRDRVISKDEIIEQVWDGRIVSDGTLTSRINSVRRAVNDDGKSQAVIRTFPRRGIRFVATVAEDDVFTEDVVSKSTPTLPDKPSIAVLPFDNLSNDPEQEYFSDGMAEDLITDLSKISGLFVVARNSSFAFKGQAVDVKGVAEQLGVRHILEGSVRKMGDKLRVNAQLVEASSGGHLWAERYDGDMTDIFQFQDDIRGQIVSALRVSLTPIDEALTEQKQTSNVKAYDLFLNGRANFYRFTPESMQEASHLLEEAIRIDPEFADTYSYLSLCHFWEWGALIPGCDDNLERAHELAEKGYSLDGSSTNAAVSLGWIKAWLHRYDEAFTIFEDSLAKTPYSSTVIATLGQVLNFWGDPEGGLEKIEDALKIESFPPPNWQLWAGHSQFLLHQYAQALPKFKLMEEWAPKFVFVHVLLACTYVELERLEDARNSIKTLLEISPQYSVKDAARIFPYRKEEDRNLVLDSLRKAGLPEG
jgi:TolB-like protein